MWALVTELARAAPVVWVQLVWVLLYAFLAVGFYRFLIACVVKPLVFRLPTAGREAWLERHRAAQRKAHGMEPGSEREALDLACRGPATCLLHCMCTLLLAPAALGLLQPEAGVAFALARHAHLYETGSNVQSLVWRFHERLFAKDGRKKQPTQLLVFLVQHHLMAFCNCLPLNVYLPEARAPFQVSYQLHVDSAVSEMFQQLGFTMDASTSHGLWVMRLGTFVVAVNMVYRRCLLFPLLSYHVFWQLSAVPELPFVVVAACGLSVCAMMYINVPLTLAATRKSAKFWHLQPPPRKVE